MKMAFTGNEIKMLQTSKRRVQLISCTTLACMHGGRDAFYLSASYRRWAMALVVVMDSSMNKSGVCSVCSSD